MKQRKTDRVQHRIAAGERTQRPHVAMHDAVEEDMTEGPEKCADECDAPGNVARTASRTGERGWDPSLASSQGQPADQRPRQRTSQPDHRSPEVSVEESMDRVLAPEEVESRFEVSDDLRVTENGETESRRCRRLESCGWAKMKRCEWQALQLVGWQGLEPWTNALKGHCSTN